MPGEPPNPSKTLRPAPSGPRHSPTPAMGTVVPSSPSGPVTKTQPPAPTLPSAAPPPVASPVTPVLPTTAVSPVAPPQSPPTKGGTIPPVSSDPAIASKPTLLATSLPAPPPPVVSPHPISGGAAIRFPQPGEVLVSPRGSYRVGRIVGQGQYGAVYDAIGPFDQRYAVKLLVPANRPYAEVQAEWLREAERLLRLRHPGVVYMHDAFELSFLFYIALEWCSASLRDLLVKPLPPDFAIEISRQILAAVQYLHDNDLVHGDLHPGNVLVVHENGAPTAQTVRVKLADFGISQELHGRGFVRPNVVHHAIMAPEVAEAGYTSRQSDIYQIGLLLYWMVTGVPPLDYSVQYEQLVDQVRRGAPRARAEALGTPLGHVIAKMLRRREAYRYGSAREVWEDLRLVPEWTTRSA